MNSIQLSFLNPQIPVRIPTESIEIDPYTAYRRAADRVVITVCPLMDTPGITIRPSVRPWALDVLCPVCRQRGLRLSQSPLFRRNKDYTAACAPGHTRTSTRSTGRRTGTGYTRADLRPQVRIQCRCLNTKYIVFLLYVRTYYTEYRIQNTFGVQRHSIYITTRSAARR